MRFFDAHTHVQFAAFHNDWKAVINRALTSGVFLINVGTQQDTSRRAVEIAHDKDGVYATVGLHPIHTEKSYHDPQELGVPNQSPPEADAVRGSLQGFTSRGEEFNYEYYKKLAFDPKVVAIGECGLDYAAFVRKRSERLQKRASAEALSEGGLPQEDVETKKKKQLTAFLKQIELAHDVKKPLMVHCREAFPDLIKLLTSNFQLLTSPPGVIHFFSGTKEDARQLLDMGFSFTFGGVVTFVRDYDEVIKSIPLDRILSETDAPYVAPAPYRGKRNEPAYVIEIVKKLAEVKNMPFEIMREQILENVKSFLHISTEKQG